MVFVTHMEITPNPNALKYVLNETVLSGGICEYDQAAEAQDDLSRALLQIEGVLSVFYRDNYITITKRDSVDWYDIEMQVKDEINSRVETVEIKAQQMTPVTFGVKAEAIAQIEQILDDTIRPGLEMDGGGLQILDLSDELELSILYHGACESCPSSETGTKAAIEGILQDQFDPRITVRIAEHHY